MLQTFGAILAFLGLLLLLLDLGAGFTVTEADGVGHLLQAVSGVGTQIGHGDDDGVGLDHRRVCNPIEEGVIVLCTLHAVPVSCMLGGTQHLKSRQRVVRGTEEHIQLVGFGT